MKLNGKCDSSVDEEVHYDDPKICRTIIPSNEIKKNNVHAEKVSMPKTLSRQKIKYWDLFQYASNSDKALVGIGTLAAVIRGPGHFIFMIMFSDMADIFIAGTEVRNKTNPHNSGFDITCNGTSSETKFMM